MAPKYQTLARYKSASLEKHTGRGWDEWIELLRTLGAEAMDRREIVRLLAKKYKLTLWWQQVVTLGFEIATGRRVEGTDARGLYSVSPTRTFPLSVEALWRLLVSKAGQELWLLPLFPISVGPGEHFETRDGYFGEVRTMMPALRLRVSWQEPEWSKKTYLQIYLAARSPTKSSLVFNHVQLANATVRAQLQRRWVSALDALSEAAATKLKT